MAKVLVSETNLTNIANAIRTKNGLSNTYKPPQMAAAILAIPTGGTSPIWNINITQSANQTISVTTSISKSGSSSYTVGASDTPTVVATVTPNSGYIAGTASVQQSGTTFNVSASAATPQSSSSWTKTYTNVVGSINNGNLSINQIGDYSDGWWVAGGIEITQYYGYLGLSKYSLSAPKNAYTFTGTLVLDGYTLDFSAVDWTSGTVNCTENANYTTFKNYIQSLGDGTHTFSSVVLTLNITAEKYAIFYGFSPSTDSSAIPSTIYWSQVVNDADIQLSFLIPQRVYLENGQTTSVWTPASPSSTVLTDSANNCRWTFSGYSPASVGGDTVNGSGYDYYINYSWVATPL